MAEEHDQIDKKVKFNDWMGESSDSDTEIRSKLKKKDDFDKLFAEDKFSKREKKGHLLLQLQKSYKGDDRFQLDKDFAVDDTKKLTSTMLGALSTKEY